MNINCFEKGSGLFSFGFYVSIYSSRAVFVGLTLNETYGAHVYPNYEPVQQWGYFFEQYWRFMMQKAFFIEFVVRKYSLEYIYSLIFYKNLTWSLLLP